MSKIRFGILGSGYMGRTHAEAVLQLGDRAALTAVSGGRRAAGLAQRYGIADNHGWRVISKQPPVGHASADTAFLETRMQAYRDQVSSFIARIRGDPAPPELPCVGTGHDGRAAVAACRAILTSSEQRRWVDLTSGATLSATQK